MICLTTKARASRRAPLAAVLALGFVGAFAGGAAHALPITFTTDPGNSTAQITSTSGFCVGLAGGCDPVVTLNPTPVTFDLDAIGDSFDIMDFLTVSVSGPSLSLGGTATLESTIAFSAPSNEVSTPASGTGTLNSVIFVSNGQVSWSTQPANLFFDDGSEVSLAFNGGSESCVLFGCLHGLSVGVDVTTTLQAVPEPATLALFGAGLFGLGMSVRRRSRSSRR